MLRIKLLRLFASLSQWHVAKAAEVSQGRYSMIERGLIEPTPTERERLATILNAPASTLFRHAVRDRRVPEKGPTHA